MSPTHLQSAVKEPTLQGRSCLNAFFYTCIYLLPETRHRRHTRGMSLPHRVLYLVWVSVDDDLRTLRECQVRPSTLKNMGVWQETDNPIGFANGHAFVVSFHGGMVLPVSEHHTLTVAGSTTGIKDIAKVVVVGLGPSFFHLTLSWQIFAQLQKVVEIQGVGVVRADTHVAIVHDDALQRVTKGEHAMSLIVLFLLSNEDKTYLRIVHNELYLLFATGCIEWNCYSANAIRTKVGVEILQAILRENSNILLRFDA